MELKTLKEMEKDAITSRYAIFKFNILKTATSLGISRATFYRRIKLHAITPIRRGDLKR